MIDHYCTAPRAQTGNAGPPNAQPVNSDLGKGAIPRSGLGTTPRCMPILRRITPAEHVQYINMTLKHPERHILVMLPDELEKFAREWALLKKGYFGVERFSGPGDMGRDVVGYLTKAKHEGEWHNYQCKQYGKAVPLASGLGELGKILHFAHEGHFTAPTKYFFVAPKGVVRPLREYISKPSQLKKVLLDKWDDYCAKTITKKKVVALTPSLETFIGGWNFSCVSVISVDDMLDDPAGKIIMAKRFKENPDPAPKGVVPVDLEDREMPYVRQLLDAYGERDSCAYASHGAVKTHDDHGPHLTMQRERFFDADAFTRFYRDNTMSEEIDELRDDIFHGVADVHGANHDDSLSRANAVMSQAATLHPSGVLSRHARVPVKQGICHHFANEGKLKWRKK
jgi:hypothetical protein